MERTHPIYKIFRLSEWEELKQAGDTAGAPVDLADGFVHFSTAAQVEETLGKHFAGQDGLWLLAVDPRGMADDLKWEISRNGELFPHLYRRLKLSEVRAAAEIPLRDGGHALPDLDHMPPVK